MDLADLEAKLSTEHSKGVKNKKPVLLIGCFTAASNVTGQVKGSSKLTLGILFWPPPPYVTFFFFKYLFSKTYRHWSVKWIWNKVSFKAWSCSLKDDFLLLKPLNQCLKRKKSSGETLLNGPYLTILHIWLKRFHESWSWFCHYFRWTMTSPSQPQ